MSETPPAQTIPEFDALDSFFQTLFVEMRSTGVLLTLNQLDDLKKAMSQGFGLESWDDFQQICQLLWVKPSPNYDRKTFNQAFEKFRKLYEKQQPVSDTPLTPPPSPPPPILNLPRVPPRVRTVPQKAGEIEVPTAVKTDSSPSRLQHQSNRTFVPIDFPVNLQDVRMAWRSLRQWVQLGHEYELDFDATLKRIQQEGVFSDIVFRPVRVRRAELVLLVDDSNAMIPFLPALQPFIKAIEERWINPAQIYRFTVFPTEYLYPWSRPTRAEPLSLLLPRFHRSQTVVLIWSDAGAAMRSYSQEYFDGMTEFLLRLAPCVRQIFWLNPLPQNRWEQTSAEAIANFLNGQMFPLDRSSLQFLSRQQTREIVLQR